VIAISTVVTHAWAGGSFTASLAIKQCLKQLELEIPGPSRKTDVDVRTDRLSIVQRLSSLCASESRIESGLLCFGYRRKFNGHKRGLTCCGL
jgi:hypothetical protein